MMAYISFLFLGLAFLSLWFYRTPKIWGTLFALSLMFGWIQGQLSPICFLWIGSLIALWLLYVKKNSLGLFIALIALTSIFIFHILPGYHPLWVTSKFGIGIEGPLIGLMPLALVVPLARTFSEWKSVFKWVLVGCMGLAVMALMATLANATSWQVKIPSFVCIRVLSNLFLTAIPEEGFFRGFVQEKLYGYFHALRWGKFWALLVSSLLFTFVHLPWSPNGLILAFVFIASLLYGTVYWFSKKIESAIVIHFLLNLLHMFFFSYHAM